MLFKNSPGWTGFVKGNLVIRQFYKLFYLVLEEKNLLHSIQNQEVWSECSQGEKKDDEVYSMTCAYLNDHVFVD